MSTRVLCRASPSLALIKYWGKRPGRGNLPATPSLAVTLGGISTETRVSLAPPGARADSVVLDGVPQPTERFLPFFEGLRRRLKDDCLRFEVESRNDFPSAAGLASSSSGFAALAVACARAAGAELSLEELSELARRGSASAARSLFGGFTLLPAGGRSARQLFPPEHWPELRILVVVVSEQAKPVSSRQAMQVTRSSSPYYHVWLRTAAGLLRPAMEALKRRDLQALGEAALASYSRMHAAMIAADPPVLYWLPGTVEVIHECRRLRGQGIGAWETLDAGPQVKILCLAPEAQTVLARLRDLPGLGPDPRLLVAQPGEGPLCRETAE
jgi:diphosphomevalonate decarboxylase